MQIVQDYKSLHAIPEPDRALPKTLRYITDSLKALKCRVFFPMDGAVCALFDFGKENALAFRADMDALPILEATDLPWKSRHPGFMPACGHDGHSAILLELARRLDKKHTLSHNVLLLFQPAEETDGGAEDLCRTGILEQHRVRCIFGLHLWPGLSAGQIFSKPGVLMGRSSGVTVRFSGKSAHIARWQQGADALSACCRFYLLSAALNTPVSLLKFGKMQGGSAGNIVCPRAELSGSLRTTENHGQFQAQVSELCRDAALQTGCQGEVLFQNGYPAVENSEPLFSLAQSLYPVTQIDAAYFTTDDFSFYQRRIPGLYCLLGIGDTPPLHSDRFSFDPAVLSVGADFFEALAEGL